MFEYLLGVLLMFLGITSGNPSIDVLGDEISRSTSSSQSTSSFGGVQIPVDTQTIEQQKQIYLKRVSDSTDTHKKAFDELRAQFTDAKDIYRTQTKNPGNLAELLRREIAAFDEQIRVQMENTAQNRISERQAFDTKVNTFSDTVKKQKSIDLQERILKHVDAQIKNINAQLDQLTEIVVENTIQVTQKPNKRSAKRFNTVAKETLMRIKEAKEDLTGLAQKSYIVDIISESHIKNDVLWTVESVEEDIQFNLKLVRNARMAVKEMIQERSVVLDEKFPGNITK